ncbi:MAG: hypothetical protein EBT07_16575, partial [Actinobacteria bacterium]|nr:hypothetical protein [Actinomycetota bacterium]
MTTVVRAEPDALSATAPEKIAGDHFVDTEPSGVKLSGYVDAGYSYNFTGSGNQSVVNGRVGEPARG